VSGEVADTARRYREALRTGDLETAVELLAPDVELALPRGTLRGREHVCAYLQEQTTLDHLDVEVHAAELEETNGSSVGATTTQVWRWRDGGEVAYSRRSRAEYTVRDGRIVRVEVTNLP
jgi:ketosteroid isomerase-like protein